MTADSEAVAAGEQSTASHPRITDITNSVLDLANEYQKMEVGQKNIHLMQLNNQHAMK